MSLWMLFVLLGLIKLPFVGLMLWMPFRNDEAMRATRMLAIPPTPPKRMEAATRCPRGPLRSPPAHAPPPLPAPRPARLAGAPGAGPGTHAGAREGPEDLPLGPR